MRTGTDDQAGPVVPPGFKPEHLRHHLETCPDCAGTFDRWCPEGRRLMAAGIEDTRRESRRNCMPEVRALMAAGWTFELPGSHDPEPWAWRWRRPGKRIGRPGKLFASTGQAYGALMRERGEAAG